jgi:hypothetical protein
MTSRDHLANQAERRLGDLLRGEEGLIGLGLEEPAPDRLEIVAHVAADDSPVCARIPGEWEGFTVRVIVTGRPHKK